MFEKIFEKFLGKDKTGPEEKKCQHCGQLIIGREDITVQMGKPYHVKCYRKHKKEMRRAAWGL